MIYERYMIFTNRKFKLTTFPLLHFYKFTEGILQLCSYHEEKKIFYAFHYSTKLKTSSGAIFWPLRGLLIEKSDISTLDSLRGKYVLI